MIQLLAAQTVVQVIGLAVVMAGNPGIDVVMPRIHSGIVHTHSIQEVQMKQAPNVSARTLVPAPAAPATIKNQIALPAPAAPSNVENHTAILAFRDVDVQGTITGWNVKPLTALGINNGTFSYVVLNGEHLRFLVNGPNPVAAVPMGLPRLSFNCIDKSAPRFAVKTKGSLARRYSTETYQPSLNAGYQPPTYPQATAVLHVPTGTTSACLANVNQHNTGRVDTRILLDNNGTVVLQATSKNGTVRTLTFYGTSQYNGEDTLLMFANVPDAWLYPAPGSSASAVDAGHYQAYYSMLDAAAESNCSRQPPSTLVACESNMRPYPGSHEPIIPHLPDGTDMVTYECSNSRYP
jgi:hypothetical protein